MADMFSPFKMPDFRSRLAAESKSLKDAYIYLRRKGFPDKDIFVYPVGSFDRFKGEIKGQSPEPGETILPGDEIVLTVNMPGITDIMPDLFIDHHEELDAADLFSGEFSKQAGVRRLFSIFDSFYLKMLCRLEWVRDIYAGLYMSREFIDYFSSLLSLPERNMPEVPSEVVGFVLPKLYHYLGTEGALMVYLKAVLGLNCRVVFDDLQTYELPPRNRKRLAQGSILGDETYLGNRFKSAYPVSLVTLIVDEKEKIRDIIPGGRKHGILMDIIRLCLPGLAENYKIKIKIDSEEIMFASGDSYLGYSTKLVKAM